MDSKVYVFDPTSTDQLSKVRGIGRYLQILRENFQDKFTFTDRFMCIQDPLKSIFINPFFNFLAPPLIMQRIAKKQVAIIHDFIPLKYPTHFPIGLKGKINVFLNKIALKHYDVIITDSIASKKDIVQILGLPENKINVIYPCLPKHFIHHVAKYTSLLPKKPFVLYVGDATWNKNIITLAKAIKLLNITCICVGKVFNIHKDHTKTEISNNESQNLSHPWQQELKGFLSETKDDKRFIFKGYIPDNELINLYQHALCNVLPSRDEGFGFSYLEASTMGCPSILADIPVLREISHNSGIFFDPNNPKKLAEIINDLLKNPVRSNSIAEHAKKRSSFFSSDQFQKSFLSICEKM